MNLCSRIPTLLIACILALGLTACIYDRTSKPEGADIRVGDRLPGFSVTLDDGSTADAGTLEGKVSLIVLMTVTCPDCQAQLPVVDRLYTTFRDNSAVKMLAISREQGEPLVGNYWQAHGFSLPYSAQEDRQVYSLFAQSGVPRIYIADKTGTVRKITTDNPLATYDELEAAVTALLGEY